MGFCGCYLRTSLVFFDRIFRSTSLLQCKMGKLTGRRSGTLIECQVPDALPVRRTKASMTILTRLEQWKERGLISPEQHALLAGLSRREQFSIFLELNILLYAGILAFVVGLGWTVSIWSQQLGDLLVLTILSAMLAACFWYCFSRAPAWSTAEIPSPRMDRKHDLAESRGGTVVIIQQATNSLSPSDRSCSFKIAQARMDKPVLQTLVVSFSVIMRNEIAGS
jgi:hypothetical protein